MKNTLKPRSTLQIDFYKRADDTTPQTTVELVNALERIQNGAWSAQVNVVRELYPGNAYDQAKKTLPGFTFCGTFRPSRKIVHLTQHNGILLGDLDKRPHVLADRAAIEDLAQPSGALAQRVLDPFASRDLVLEVAGAFRDRGFQAVVKGGVFPAETKLRDEDDEPTQ